MPAPMTALTLTLRHPCVRCHGDLPVRSLSRSVGCVICGHATPLSPDSWRDLVPRAAVAEQLLGDGGDGPISSRLPRCADCARPVALSDLPGAVPVGGLRCACGQRIPVRAADALASDLVPGALYIVGERPPPAAASPILFACMGCGAAMSADGRRRVEDCGRCRAANYLPDALWSALHPVAEDAAITIVARLSPEARLALSLESPATARALAASGDLDPALLPVLIAAAAPSVRAALAGNPAVPDATRLRLAGDPEPSVRAALVGCAAARPRLLLDADPAVRAALAACPDTPPTALARLAGDPAPIVRVAVARAPGVPDAALCAMAALESEESVLLALLDRPVLPDGAITAMAGPGQSARIARLLAARACLPEPAAALLAGHFEDTVRQTLLTREDLPARALHTLAADASPAIRQEARARPDFVIARRSRRRLAILLSSALVLLSGAGGLLGAALLAARFSDDLLRLMP
jgi:hypothetical protein